MSTHHTVRVKTRDLQADKLGFFRFGELGDGIIVTNELGQWHHLAADEFESFLTGGIAPGHDAYDDLAAKGFLRDELDLDQIADQLRRRKKFVGMGPHLHLLQLAGADTRLSVEVAKEIIDHVMLSTSPRLDLELVQGSQSLSVDLLQFIAEYATEKNRYEGKQLSLRVVSDFDALSDELVTWAAGRKVRFRTTLAGPAAIHDALCAVPHATVTERMGAIHTAYQAKRLDPETWAVEATVPVGAPSLADPAAIAQALADAGVRRARLSPITSGAHAITTEQYVAFYTAWIKAALALAEDDDIDLREAAGETFVARALGTDDPDDSAVRSPSGYGMAQFAYDTAGNMFPSDVARSLFEAGNDMFHVGKAGVDSYKDTVCHPTVRAVALASLLECLPGFQDRWSTPYCGVDPISSFALSGDLFPKQASAADARRQHAVVTALFELLVSDEDLREGLEDWLV